MKKLKKSLLKKYNLSDLDKLGELSRLSRLSVLELISVLYDIKEVQADTVTLNKELIQNLPTIKKLVRSLNLQIAQSKVKYIVNSPRGIFEEIPLKDPREGKIILSVSKSLPKAEMAVQYYHDKMLDSRYGRKFGKLMGYPDCCLDFGDYLNNNNKDPNNFGFKNPAIESLKRSKHFVWQLNVFTWSCLPYFPCSLNCSKSINFVNDLLTIIKYWRPEFAKEIIYYLKEPVSLYWSCADRIFLFGNFKKYHLGTGEVKYSKVEVHLDSETYYEANDPKYIKMLHQIEIKIKQGDKLIVDDKKIQIFKDKNKIAEFPKINQYIPVLVKPDKN